MKDHAAHPARFSDLRDEWKDIHDFPTVSDTRVGDGP